MHSFRNFIIDLFKKRNFTCGNVVAASGHDKIYSGRKLCPKVIFAVPKEFIAAGI
jgi:hypothetical protein